MGDEVNQGLLCKGVEDVSISDKAKEVHEEANNAVDNKITIMTINVKNNDGAGVEVRRPYFKNLITKKKPHVILSQECDRDDLACFENYALYQYTPLSYEATILLKKDQDVFRPDEYFQKPIATTAIEGNINPSDNIVSFINNRLALGRVRIGERWLYIGSWHGPYNKPGTGKKGTLTDRVKQQVFIKLRKFMSEIVSMEGDKVNHHPWIVGGDFNIEHYKVNKPEHLGGNAKIIHTFDNIIYYLCHPGLIGCGEEVASYMVKKHILDHKPAMLTIDMTNYEVWMERKSKADKKSGTK